MHHLLSTKTWSGAGLSCDCSEMLGGGRETPPKPCSEVNCNAQGFVRGVVSIYGMFSYFRIGSICGLSGRRKREKIDYKCSSQVEGSPRAMKCTVIKRRKGSSLSASVHLAVSGLIITAGHSLFSPHRGCLAPPITRQAFLNADSCLTCTFMKKKKKEEGREGMGKGGSNIKPLSAATASLYGNH